MIRKFLIVPIVLLIGGNLSKAQIPVSWQFDCNGNSFDGYFDPILYSPKIKVAHLHTAESYELGYYYDQEGRKIEGQIKFKEKKIFFKDGEEEYGDKITTDEVQSFVIGLDSFFTVSNYHYNGILKKSPSYVQYVAAFDNYVFAKHFHFRTLTLSGQSPIVPTILVKERGEALWYDFPDDYTFKGFASKYFGHIPYVKEKIDREEWKKDDLMSMIKMAEYDYKYQQGLPINLDGYWEETIRRENQVYRVEIESRQDSIWTMNYFQGGMKLYSAKYSSFYPNTKNGDFDSYYTDGTLRQKIRYRNNKPQEVRKYFPSGVLHYHYLYAEDEEGDLSNRDVLKQYVIVNDSLGNNILNPEGGDSFERIYDHLSNRNYIRHFSKGRLKSAYWMSDEDTVFQIVNKNDYDFKVNRVQGYFDSYLEDNSLDQALSENAQGVILAAVSLDSRGYIEGVRLLNKIHPELDALIEGFINMHFYYGSGHQIKLKPFRNGTGKKRCEFIIPIEFGINRFYRPPVSYNYDYMFQHQMMMNQMMMNQMNSIPNVSPPGF